MSFSSVFVVSNALRLRWFKAKHTSHENTDMEFRQENDKKENKGASQMEKVLNIEGMVCMNCVKHVEKALRELAGISEVTVSLAEKSARIQLNGDVSDAMLKEAVEDAGYQLISIQQEEIPMKAKKGEVIHKLKIARGQIDGILQMIEEDRYCVDISNQLQATQALLKSANQQILQAHIRNCVREALQTDVENPKLEEALKVLEKMAQ